MRKAISFGCLLVFTFCAVFAFATAQQGDKLSMDGKEYSIYTNPLEPFLEKNPGKLPKSTVTSTSLWRGYVATWTVKDGHLLLTDVQILHVISQSKKQGWETEMRSVMKQMFPGQKEVFATWYTGHIVVPDGELVNYVHMGYASVYEKYILLRIENGVVSRQWNASRAEFVKFRDAQFDAFKKTEEYRKILEESRKEGGLDPQQNEEFLREFYSERYMSMIFDEHL